MATLDPADYPDIDAGWLRYSQKIDGSLRHFTGHVSLLDIPGHGLSPLKQKALDGNGQPLPAKYDNDLPAAAPAADPKEK